MILRFSTRELLECGEDERLAIRKWGQEVGRGYVRRLILLEEVPTFSLLSPVRSLRLHKLTGVGDDIYSVTLHGRWRLILRKVSETELEILEVSNHYGN